MRGLLQRVTEARVSVGGEVVGEIGAGLCVFVGVTHADAPEHAAVVRVGSRPPVRNTPNP